MTDQIRDVVPGPVVQRWFEDIEVGLVRTAGPVTVTAEEIVRFAERYDPLPMHVSEAAGAETEHRGMIASGVLTIAIKQRMIMSIERNTAIIGAVRLDDLNFLLPVRPGDELSLRQECVSKRESRSRPDRGLVAWQFDVTNQDGALVMTSRDHVMTRRRPAD